MALDLRKFDALDWVEDDEDLVFLLNDALDSGDADYLDSALVIIERAKVLSPALDPASAARLFRAADAIGRKMITSPRAADDRRAA